MAQATVAGIASAENEVLGFGRRPTRFGYPKINGPIIRCCRLNPALTPKHIPRLLPFYFTRITLSPMQPSPQPHSQPRTLDELLANAEHYADFCMRNSGRITPALFLIGPDGQGMVCPESLADEHAKDNFANNARLVCIAHGATACVMTLESWMKTAAPGEKLDMTEPPSEAFDRREVVVLMGKSHDGRKQKFLPIIRSGNGKFFGFGEPEVPGMDEIKGRFAQILPNKVPDDAMRDLAKVMLKVKDVKVAQQGKR